MTGLGEITLAGKAEGGFPVIPDPEVQPTMSVEAAGRLCGLRRSAAYEAVKRGSLPSIAFGRRRVVPTAALRRLLQLDGLLEVAQATRDEGTVPTQDGAPVIPSTTKRPSRGSPSG